MGIEKVVFYSTSNRPEDEGIVTKYTITGQNLKFILNNDIGFKELYTYLASVAIIEQVKSVPK